MLITQKHPPTPQSVLCEAGLQGADLRVQVGGPHMPECTQENNSVIFITKCFFLT